MFSPSEWVEGVGAEKEQRLVVSESSPSMEGYRYPWIVRDGKVYTMSVDGIYVFEEEEWKREKFQKN